MSMDIAKKATTNGTILREMVISLPLSLNGLLDSVAPAPLPDASNEQTNPRVATSDSAHLSRPHAMKPPVGELRGLHPFTRVDAVRPGIPAGVPMRREPETEDRTRDAGTRILARRPSHQRRTRLRGRFPRPSNVE
jgi:hypothetical protein